MTNIVKLLFTALTIAFAISLIGSTGAGAADARQFNAGRIIDDTVFTNSSSMSVNDIQRFLESKVTCDTWGQKRSELGGGTRAQWMAARGYYGPFRCITDFKENPSTGQSNYGSETTPSGAISAAQIIYNYSVQFSINPQVLLATLQKENGMITDEWPTPKQYREAMGFGCPDNVAPGAPACDPSYGSFSTQIYQAARHFRGYINNQAGWWVPFTTGSNSIAWSPNASCGRGTVNIENRATVALYSYTPYQPNQAALNAQYGTGDGCSAYGNRNFFLYFTDWFGSTMGSLSVSDVRVSTDSIGQIFTGGPVTVSFTARNLTKSNFAFSSIGVAVRDPSGRNLDPGWENGVNIAPGQTYTYSKTFLPTSEGQYSVYLSSYAANDSNWRECELNNTQSSCRTPKIIQHPLVITQGIDFTDKASGQLINEFRKGRSFLGSYQIKNTSALYSAKVGKLMIAGRNDAGESRDFGLVNAGTLAPQQNFRYEQEGVVTDSSESVKFYTSLTKDDGKNWEEVFFVNTGNTQQVRSTQVKPGYTLVEGPTTTNVNSYVGSPVAITVKVKNYSDTPVDSGKIGIIVRGPQGQNADPGWERVENLSNTTNDGVYTYRANFTPSVAGNWTLDYTQVSADMKIWNAGYPVSDTNNVKRSGTVVVKEAVTLLEGPTTTASKLYVNSPATVTVKIKNYSNTPVDLGKIGIIVRGPQGQNADPGWERVENLSNTTNDGVYTYRVSFVPTAPGNWTINYTQVSADMKVWNANYPANDSSATKRSLVTSVLPQATVVSSVSSDGDTLGLRRVSFTVKNNGTTSINLGKVGLIVRDPNNNNMDPLWQDFVIAAGATKEYAVSMQVAKTGVWTFTVGSYENTVWKSLASDDANINQSLKLNIR